MLKKLFPTPSYPSLLSFCLASAKKPGTKRRVCHRKALLAVALVKEILGKTPCEPDGAQKKLVETGGFEATYA